MSQIRGGLNWYDIRIADQPLFGPAQKVEFLVALTDAAADIFHDELKPEGVILHNSADGNGDINMNLDAVAKETEGDKLYSNAVAAGPVMSILGYDLAGLETLLRKQFAKKDPEVISCNIACARQGAQLSFGKSRRLQAPKSTRQSSHVYDGATAVGLSAAISGMKFATAYPMTPATATFTYLAGVADEYGIVVEQAEDEIAAINMVCGAARVYQR